MDFSFARHALYLWAKAPYGGAYGIWTRDIMFRVGPLVAALTWRELISMDFCWKQAPKACDLPISQTRRK